MTNFALTDIQFLQRALILAQQAEREGEVPVGAVLVLNNEIIGEGWNRPIQNSDPTAHAEIEAIRAAAAKINNYRLLESTLYVTLEPCAMCMGAILHSRIKKLIYGASDPKAGAVQSVLSLAAVPQFNHQVECVGGVLEHDCGLLLKTFFKKKRLKTGLPVE